MAAQAQGFSVNSALIGNPALLPFGPAAITLFDRRGRFHRGIRRFERARCAAKCVERAADVPGCRTLSAQSTSLTNYAGAFYQDIATQTQTASTNSTTQSDRLTEAQSLQSQISGVNLDDQLSKMVIYQQAYSAGARLLQVAQALDQTLEQDVT